MCKLIIGIQKEPSQEFRALIQAQYSDLKMEKDGCGALLVMRNGDVKVKRSLKDYEPVFEFVNDNISNAVMVGLHTRSSTSGALSEENVHFFEENGIYFAHNGFVTGALNGKVKVKKTTGKEVKEITIAKRNKGEYEKCTDIMLRCADCSIVDYQACKKHDGIMRRIMKLEMDDEVKGGDSILYDGEYTYQEVSHMGYQTKTPSYWKDRTGACDSREFLSILAKAKDLGEDTINKLCVDNRFNGVAVAYDSKTKRVALIVDKGIHSISDDKSYLAIFSYDPETAIETYKSKEIFDVPLYEKDESEIERPDRGVYQGVHNISLPFPEIKRSKNKQQ